MRFRLDFQLETPRCRLRPVSLDDIPHVFSATQFSGFNEGMPWDPPARLEDLSAPHQRGIDAWKNDLYYSFTVTQKAVDELIGRISIRPQGADVWNIGFWMHPVHQRKGFTTEAAIAMLSFGFLELNAIQIEAAHAVWNKASERVLQKVGMSFVKRIAEGFQKRGVWVEENLLAISRQTWEERQRRQS
jgi:ribosomal-protein-alanine N-acetyltransferase